MPRFAVFDPFLSVVMVCWRNDPHAAFHVCVGHKTGLPSQGKARQCGSQQRAVVLLMPSSAAEVSGTAVTAEAAQEAGQPWTMVVQPNSECFWEELAAVWCLTPCWPWAQRWHPPHQGTVATSVPAALSSPCHHGKLLFMLSDPANSQIINVRKLPWCRG